MKILFIADNLGGGGKERRLIELIKSISKNDKYTVDIIILDNNIFYQDIFNSKCNITIFKRKGKFELPLRKKLLKEIKRISPDCIHIWGNIGMFYVLSLYPIIKKTIINSTIADTSPQGGFFIKSLRKLSYMRSEIILSNTYLGIKAYKAPKHKSKVIYNGFDFQRINSLTPKHVIKHKLAITTPFVFMMVGHYSQNKDYNTFIKGGIKLLEKRRDITFITCGYGDFIQYQNMIPSIFKENFKLLNFQKDIESIMNIADIGVLCSNVKNHGEGISNVLLEFMALKKPVIATNFGGNKELIINNKSGFLIKPNNEEDLLEKYNILLEKQNLYDSMSQLSYEIVKAKFGIETMISEFDKLYNSLS